MRSRWIHRTPLARVCNWSFSLAMMFFVAAGGRALLAQAPTPTKKESPEVMSLSTKGVHHVDEHDLQKSIATQASKCGSFIFRIICPFSRSPTFWQKHYLDRDEFRRDVLRIKVYYWRRGYRETTVDTSITKKGTGVAVTFDINEGPPTIVSALRIDYDSTILPRKVRNRLALVRVGKPLNMLQLDSMRLAFQSEMWNRGYGDAIVDTAIAVNDSTRRAAVGVRVFPNWPTTVGNIIVLGNQRVATNTILDMLELRPGRPFIRDAVLESQRTLYTSNLFRLATILPPTGDSIKRVEIQVVEAPLHDARIGGGGDNVNYLQIQGTYTAYNLLGGARRLDINGTVGNLLAPTLGKNDSRLDNVEKPSIYLQPTWGGSIDFNQPAFLRRPANQLGFGIFAHRRSEPSIYIDRGYGAQTVFTRQLAQRASGSLTYHYEVTRVEAGDIYFCVNYGVCDTTTISTLRRHQTLSPLTLTAFVDRSDQAFSPTKGYIARVTLEDASRYTISDYRYNRAFLDMSTYWHPSLRPEVLATHLKLGFVRAMTSAAGDTVLHPRTRFYAGGAMSVRGYGENQLGPRVLTISDSSLRVSPKGVVICPLTKPITQCNPNDPLLGDGAFIPRPTGGTSLVEGSVELRVPVAHRLEGALFVDGAIVGVNNLQGLNDLKKIADFAHNFSAITPGFGIRYISPVGPIRVDLGYNPNLTETLPVVTNRPDGTLVALDSLRNFTQGRNNFLGHLVLHLSIGQAF